MPEHKPTIFIDEHGDEYAYTRAMAMADRREIDRLLRPLNDAWLARLGLSREEAFAMMRAGEPCPVLTHPA